MILVDTNILVYSVDRRSPHHDACKRWIEAPRAITEALCTTWPILYEFLRVVTHPGVLRPPLSATAAMDVVDLIVRSPGFKTLVATPAHAQVARRVINEASNVSGNIMHDLHTVVLMREHGIRRICTRDADFRRFPHIEVVDPAQI